MSACPDSPAESAPLRLLPMHPEHLPQVLAIERRVYAFPWSEGIFRDCLRAGYSAWVVVNSLGEVQGYGLLTMAVGEAHLLNLCVSPERQRQGIARFVLEHLMRLARAANCTVMLLEVRRSNKAAMALYEAYGFQRVGLRKNYYPAEQGREDAFVYAHDFD
ncbi:ribosomal protein S18-alanine N-acetyltransferase [Algiphilus sp. W345]|uniref:[Ribosomal protein bS18]-alanine N-acetyltransferase n=1 Tax=Banduia mediterranea TaxID=3075609 RepID=A0ABU2WGL7_9GAMM|nr:ribosomal protein S18-alanine N-acetyltransferase [Algiphilus sp. W345]MDT0497017.1 ribosomal protein S18-alanine N-acetyltransferase [Algiphilus sp. W345]